MARKSLPPLRDVADPYIQTLWKLHDSRKLDKRSKAQLKSLIRDVAATTHIVDSLLERCNVTPQAKMGRHARLSDRQDQLWLDFKCWRLCHEKHDGQHALSWDKAYEEVGEEVNLGPEAVKLRRFKVERIIKDDERTAKGARSWQEKV